LVTEPPEVEQVTLYAASSNALSAETDKKGYAAWGMGCPFFSHWKWMGTLLCAWTPNVAVSPSGTDVFRGCSMITGGSAGMIVSTASRLVIDSRSLLTRTRYLPASVGATLLMKKLELVTPGMST